MMGKTNNNNDWRNITKERMLTVLYPLALQVLSTLTDHNVLSAFYVALFQTFQKAFLQQPLLLLPF